MTKVETMPNDTSFSTRTYYYAINIVLNLPFSFFYCSARKISICLLVRSNLFVGYKKHYIFQNQQGGRKLN
jgi:hypothetical protein